MARPKSKKSLTATLKFRLHPKEKNRIKGLARIYAKGNIGRWLRHAALNADRKYLK